MPQGRYGDAEALAQAIANLPPGQRKAIELIKLRELSLKKASPVSEMSVGALKVAVHRGIAEHGNGRAHQAFGSRRVDSASAAPAMAEGDALARDRPALRCFDRARQTDGRYLAGRSRSALYDRTGCDLRDGTDRRFCCVCSVVPGFDRRTLLLPLGPLALRIGSVGQGCVARLAAIRCRRLGRSTGLGLFAVSESHGHHPGDRHGGHAAPGERSHPLCAGRVDRQIRSRLAPRQSRPVTAAPRKRIDRAVILTGICTGR